MRLLICGSRNWFDEAPIRAAIEALPPGSIVIHGNARGADSIADRVAITLRIHVKAYAAAWATHGRDAGPIRNQRMLDEGKPDRVLAFPLTGSKGTWDMVRRARQAGVPVVVWGAK